MPEDFIRLPSDDAGKRSRTIASVIGNVEVQTQVVNLSDNTGSIIGIPNSAQQSSLLSLSSSMLSAMDANHRDNRDLQKAVITQLKVISIKLNCLQPGGEELDENDLDDLENDA